MLSIFSALLLTVVCPVESLDQQQSLSSAFEMTLDEELESPSDLEEIALDDSFEDLELIESDQ